MLLDIKERMVKVQTKIDSMAEDAEKTANEALASTKSSHKKIDKIDKIFL
ncbi:hypothetical protein DFR56_103359 [Pseudogracilibacillus auburnensis]|uniref:Uncharacterized protein n=2 Tax=Pseudogracilibacillus auburnensis TaxID=1494959 RepID=A0A2V3W3D6_9BACI|nr:hypothetical protein DFR56_103359 [Pseudogracilibacillus auburnensis]